MQPGLTACTCSGPRFQRSIVPGRKFSTMTSAIAHRPVSGPLARASVAIRLRDERVLGPQDVHPHDRLGALGRALAERRDELAMAGLRERAVRLVAPERRAEA